MKTIYFATKNTGKFESMKLDLKNLNVNLEMYETDIMEPRTYKLEEIASKKVLEAYKKIKKPCIAIDAGFYLNQYENFPGAFTNFILDTIGIDGIIDLVKDKNKEAYFADALAYMDETLDKPIVTVSKTIGKCSVKQKGTMQSWHWSKLSLIFIPTGYDKTLAELTYQEFLSRRNKKTFGADFINKILNEDVLSQAVEKEKYYLI